MLNFVPRRVDLSSYHQRRPALSLSLCGAALLFETSWHCVAAELRSWIVPEQVWNTGGNILTLASPIYAFTPCLSRRGVSQGDCPMHTVMRVAEVMTALHNSGVVHIGQSTASTLVAGRFESKDGSRNRRSGVLPPRPSEVPQKRRRASGVHEESLTLKLACQISGAQHMRGGRVVFFG